MAVDVVLLEPRGPDGAPTGPGAMAQRIGARDDPGKGVAEAVGKGLPSTAVGRRISARVGLILARVDETAAPRETRRR